MMAASLLAIAERGPPLAYAHNGHLQREKSTMRMGGLPLEWWSAGAIVSAQLGEGYAFLRRGDLHLDIGRYEVRRAERTIALTRKEFGVLTALMRADGALSLNPGTLCSRQDGRARRGDQL